MTVRVLILPATVTGIALSGINDSVLDFLNNKVLNR